MYFPKNGVFNGSLGIHVESSIHGPKEWPRNDGFHHRWRLFFLFLGYGVAILSGLLPKLWLRFTALLGAKLLSLLVVVGHPYYAKIISKNWGLSWLTKLLDKKSYSNIC